MEMQVFHLEKYIKLNVATDLRGCHPGAGTPEWQRKYLMPGSCLEMPFFTQESQGARSSTGAGGSGWPETPWAARTDSKDRGGVSKRHRSQLERATWDKPATMCMSV